MDTRSIGLSFGSYHCMFCGGMGYSAYRGVERLCDCSRRRLARCLINKRNRLRQPERPFPKVYRKGCDFYFGAELLLVDLDKIIGKGTDERTIGGKLFKSAALEEFLCL